MQAEIEEPAQASSFLVLLIVKLHRDGCLIGSTHAYRRGRHPIRVDLNAEAGSSVREEAYTCAPTPLRAWNQFGG